MTKEQAKEKVQQLLERYNNLTDQEVRAMNEETTKGKFIRPLFEALGWNFEDDVLWEDKVSHDRVDFNFQINGRTKFFLEAKPLKADLDELRYAQQATNYAYLKNVNWAVLTDFEGIRIFYPAEHGQAKSCLRLNYRDYLNSFDDLWILSRESFEQDLIDQQAVKWGAKPEQVKVSTQLANDLARWRDHLAEQFQLANEEKNISEKLLDEGVQKIIDRLIFIRSCEDRKLENDSLLSRYRIWQDDGRKGNFLAHLKPLFSEYKQNYNSGLFDDHPMMDWEIYSDSFDDIMKGLYTSKNGQEYDFSVIDADVLGSVYEQYLGHLLSKSDDGDATKKKRKSQGIYYTPTFIVDYIIENTLGEVLQEKSSQEIANLRILDPACGSGSFLIKAYEYLLNYYSLKENNKVDLKTKLGKLKQAFRNRDGAEELSTAQKINILRNNIYGVDLDEQAVEIAQLNLLLKTLERKQQLPHLSNIKCGNSLVDDPKIAGDKAFNWNEQFSEVMQEGGFDIIIGNPPYVNLANISDCRMRDFLQKGYKTAKNKSDLYSFFVEKALSLLKNHGILGFIISNSWLGTDSFSKFREFLLNNTKILEITKLPPVFPDASVVPVLLFVEKISETSNYKIKLSELKLDKIECLVNQLFRDDLLKSPHFSFSFTPKIKFNIETEKLGDIAKFSLGIKTSDDAKFILDLKKDDECKKLLRGKDVFRYYYKPADKWLWYKPKLMMEKTGAGPRKPEYFQTNKILFRSITGGSVIAALDEENYFTNDKVHVLYSLNKSTMSLTFILGIVNSRLINYWIKSTFNDLLELKINQLQQIPIPKIDFTKKEEKFKYDELVELVNRILKLNKELFKNSEGTNHWSQLKSEVDRTNRLIDQKVYKLYGLDKKEIELVENS